MLESPIATVADLTLGDWFTIRVVFHRDRAEMFVGDAAEPGLVIGELKRPITAGAIGIMAGSPAIHVSRFAYGTRAGLSAPRQAALPERRAVVTDWLVSDAFPEALLGSAPALAPELVAGRTMRRPGLVDLARVNGIRDGRNTVLARAALHADRAEVRALEVGFRDRAVVYLNGQALYRGDDTYRSRDYRFLGSIDYYDTLFVPLVDGDNDLAVAVSEDFGGWGVQARLLDA